MHFFFYVKKKIKERLERVSPIPTVDDRGRPREDGEATTLNEDGLMRSIALFLDEISNSGIFLFPRDEGCSIVISPSGADFSRVAAD